MESQREITRRYSALMDDVTTNDFYKVDLKGRFNNYICPCGHITKTKDVDAGVTPAFMTCEACNKHRASSTFYQDRLPHTPHEFEWYRPDLNETMKLRKNPALLEHVLKGGLLRRKSIL